METTLLLILTIISIVILITTFIKKPNKNENNSQDFLLTLNENLRKEIQEIRREMTNSSELGRKEIENKLLDINKGIINFQNNSLFASEWNWDFYRFRYVILYGLYKYRRTSE